jgi:plasmid stability protein
MKRTLVQFDESTYRSLRQQAFRKQRSVSAVVRELVAKGLESEAARQRPPSARQFLSVRAGRSKQGRAAAVSERHDEALGAAFDA